MIASRRSSAREARRLGLGAIGVALLVAGCGSKGASTGGSAPTTGTIVGHITIKGDPPPDVNVAAAADCAGARDFYGKLFRVAGDGSLADALVAVTNYKGDVAAPSPGTAVSIAGCHFDRRTVVAMFGQHVDVSNTDPSLTFLPYLDGAPFRVPLAAMPLGKAIELYPDKPGHYLLRDLMNHRYMIADVFVLPYPTAAVTGVDGRFKIEGVPLGKARIDAKLPALEHKTEGKDIDVKPGENVVDIELPAYSAAADKAVAIPEPVWGDRVPGPAPPPKE